MNNNLAIANRLSLEGIHMPLYYTVTLKSRLKVTGNGTIGQIIHDLLLVGPSRYLTLNIIVTLKCGLEITRGH